MPRVSTILSPQLLAFLAALCNARCYKDTRRCVAKWGGWFHSLLRSVGT